MDFRLTDEQRALQAAARDFARGEMTAVAEQTERDATPLSRDWVRRYAEMGFLGVNVSVDYGGLGLGNVDAFLVLEEFAKVSSAVAFPIFESVAGPVHALAHFASDDVKQRVIPAVCRGEMIVAVAMSEPDAGTALTDLRTRGEVRGDRVVINGAKRWCSGGGHSDAYLVYCHLSDAPG
ncbi:MAG: acyl-CoA/acyl-ACP dehydrogenase, partial [Vicinamibacterales bacterium]|nr:acyl-CoA/acyl-ACP dehydrogenase [Vicinamibacterales bacterium]